MCSLGQLVESPILSNEIECFWGREILHSNRSRTHHDIVSAHNNYNTTSFWRKSHLSYRLEYLYHFTSCRSVLWYKILLSQTMSLLRFPWVLCFIKIHNTNVSLKSFRNLYNNGLNELLQYDNSTAKLMDFWNGFAVLWTDHIFTLNMLNGMFYPLVRNERRSWKLV